MPVAAVRGQIPAAMPEASAGKPAPWADNTPMLATRTRTSFKRSAAPDELGQSVDRHHHAPRMIAIANAPAKVLTERDRCLQRIKRIEAKFRFAADERVVITDRCWIDVHLTRAHDYPLDLKS